MQRAAARFCNSDYGYTSSVSSMLDTLGLEPLEKRRRISLLLIMYKMIHGFIDINGLNFSDFFELALDTRTRANHPFKLFVKSAKVNPYKYSFFVCIVKDWNNLPLHVVEAESFNIFKTRLKSFLNL